MSDDQPETSDRASGAQLRREALLPTERNRGLGTVAVVCTMAGVASGLALATTLMAMQVADSMSPRPYCGAAHLRVDSDRGFLGVSLGTDHGMVAIDRVAAGTPAALVDLRHGDHLLSLDGIPVVSQDDFIDRISAHAPGSQPTLVVERDGTIATLTPTLIGRPTLTE